MSTPELIDPATVQKLVQQAVSNYEFLAEIVNEFGIELATVALPTALAAIERHRYEEWWMCRQWPGERKYHGGDNSFNPATAMPYKRPALPKSIDELVAIARRAGADRRRRQQNATPVEKMHPGFWDNVKRRARLLEPFQAQWLIQRLAAIANGAADDLGEMPEPPKRVSAEEHNARVAAGFTETHSLRLRGKTHCRACGFGEATCEGCPNCGASAAGVVGPRVVVVAPEAATA